MSLYRILCVNSSRAALGGLIARIWDVTGLVRWNFGNEPDGPFPLTPDRADRIILDWTPDRIKNAIDWWDSCQVPDKVWHFSESPVRPPGVQAIEIASIADLVGRIQELVGKPKRSPVSWPPFDPTLARAQSELGSSLPLVVEKYLPDRTGRATVHAVTGGWSGTPLLRLTVEDDPDQYYLKFFQSKPEFIREWDSHNEAMEWLPQYVVPLVGIPGVDYNGTAQAEAFSVRADKSFPICYKSASVTATLKGLYCERSAEFIADAYESILDCLSSNQAPEQKRMTLLDLPDCGPGVEAGPEVPTILETLRSGPFQVFIWTAVSDVSRYGERMIGREHWRALLHSLETTLLNKPPAWITEPCAVSYGRIHGDANARNFLFDSRSLHVNRLQVVDCGSFRPNAPLVFDLAQLESDLKVILMCTDEHADGYYDADSGIVGARLVEDSSVETGLSEMTKTDMGASFRLTYQIVSSIRRRARAISDSDPDGRAYSLCLLYWTLRKVRLSGLPHLKRLLALYSAAKICEHFEKWRPR